ncbi:PREDICTED: DNA helicase MCM8-like [Nicrophorus vespilloides]|uniref:DNA helicase MCM8 n=1 Tax=Nicrophorus vespilloides TaxID=110193 RepID=A0ABM1MAP3_NICVS|nr:PREDICTED: DNA helicase MCM8-like [Nicrophorus vespilloides]
MYGYKKYRKGSKVQNVTEIYNYKVKSCYGYSGFQLYFNSEGSNNIEKLVSNTETFASYIYKNITLFPIMKIKEKQNFHVDLKLLLNDTEFNREWDNFSAEIIDNTEYCLSCMGLAMHQVVLKDQQRNYNDKDVEQNTYSLFPKIFCRVLNNDPILQIRKLKVNLYGKLISVRGTVIKRCPLEMSAKTLAFSCATCLGTQVVEQLNGNYTMPIKCLSTGCRQLKLFNPLLSSPYSRKFNRQIIKLQELLGYSEDQIARIPRTLECELSDDLIDQCTPGDDVLITGVLKVHNIEEANALRQSTMYLLYLDCISIINEKKKLDGISYYAIQKIHAEPNLFRLLVHSLCPTIYGLEMVKAGLLLGLFGGTQNSRNSRSNSHILMIGDPGLGKSQMLQSCCNVSPRGVYVCGNTSTASGLTAMLTRENGGDFALEAGALVLADQGCCFIDEFDKMSQHHSYLLELMEQQSISIAKAGVRCTLPAKTSVLAAGNPAGGHYNKAKCVAENLKISAPLLSRFDLIFILMDKPNEQLDMKLSEHVLAFHSKKRNNSSFGSSNASTQSTYQNESTPLSERLKVNNGESIDHLPHFLMRQYIAYARKYVHPKLSKDAQTVLKEFYLELRKQHSNPDSMFVTCRQLQSLVRLTEARAKLELRELATSDDANDVVEITRFSLLDTFSEDGEILTGTQRKPNTSKQTLLKGYLENLQRKVEITGKTCFDTDGLKLIANQMGLQNNKDMFDYILSTLNVQGYLLKKGAGIYQYSCAL